MTPKIITTTPTKPPRMIIYGEHKIGKSTFAKGCPAPIFIQTEDGLESLGVQAFEKCNSYQDVISCLEWLTTQPHDFKTMVLDSLDWTEKLIWEKICSDNHWPQIGDGPYGAGYKLALNYWREIIKHLDVLSGQRKMMICLVAHAKISKFEDPEQENYDRYSIDLHDKSANLLCEYVDIIGFANEETIVKTKKEGFAESKKAKSTGRRVLNLSKKAAFEAGNRYNLPDKLPFDWKSLQTAISEYFATLKKGSLTAVIDEIDAERLRQNVKEMIETGGIMPSDIVNKNK